MGNSGVLENALGSDYLQAFGAWYLLVGPRSSMEIYGLNTFFPFAQGHVSFSPVGFKGIVAFSGDFSKWKHGHTACTKFLGPFSPCPKRKA